MDLVIDPGLGLWDLPSFLRLSGLCDGSKPVMAVATHVHFDHAGGLHQFAQVAVHELEATALGEGDDYEVRFGVCFCCCVFVCMCVCVIRNEKKMKSRK